jgi:hypothetical protein
VFSDDAVFLEMRVLEKDDRGEEDAGNNVEELDMESAEKLDSRIQNKETEEGPTPSSPRPSAHDLTSDSSVDSISPFPFPISSYPHALYCSNPHAYSPPQSPLSGPAEGEGKSPAPELNGVPMKETIFEDMEMQGRFFGCYFFGPFFLFYSSGTLFFEFK